MSLLRYLPLLCMLNASVSFAQEPAVIKDSALAPKVSDNAVKDSAASPVKVAPVRYVKEMNSYLPPVASAIQLSPYYDYPEAAAAAKKLKKPLILYFTGITNNNARMMEKKVWSNPTVAKMLREDFVIAFLYCDEKQLELPVRQQYYSKYIHKQIIHIGDKNQDFQGSRYGTNGQPMMYFVNDDFTKILPEPLAHNVDVPRFIEYLNKVKEVYASTH